MVDCHRFRSSTVIIRRTVRGANFASLTPRHQNHAGGSIYTRNLALFFPVETAMNAVGRVVEEAPYQCRGVINLKVGHFIC
jgi:hypothetical protein